MSPESSSRYDLLGSFLNRNLLLLFVFCLRVFLLLRRRLCRSSSKFWHPRFVPVFHRLRREKAPAFYLSSPSIPLSSSPPSSYPKIQATRTSSSFEKQIGKSLVIFSITILSEPLPLAPLPSHGLRSPSTKTLRQSLRFSCKLEMLSESSKYLWIVV